MQGYRNTLKKSLVKNCLVYLIHIRTCIRMNLRYKKTRLKNIFRKKLFLISFFM